MFDRDQRFTGHFLLFDHDQRIALSTGVQMWAGPVSCGFEMSDGRGGGLERVEFEQRQIVWAMTCMIRLMRRRAYRATTPRATSKPRARRQLTRICPECGGQGETEVEDRLTTCPVCGGARWVRG